MWGEQLRLGRGGRALEQSWRALDRGDIGAWGGLKEKVI